MLLITAIDREMFDQNNNKKKIRVRAKVKELFSFWLCPSQQSMHHCFTDIS